MISVVAIILFCLFLGQDHYSKKTHRIISVCLFLLILATCAARYVLRNEGLTHLIGGFTSVFSVLVYCGIGGKKVAKRQLSFNCPFCHSGVEFSSEFENESKNCPDCNQVIKVTEDEEVHKAYKESYDNILEAMDSEELQEDTSTLEKPQVGSSVFGQPFN